MYCESERDMLDALYDHAGSCGHAGSDFSGEYLYLELTKTQIQQPALVAIVIVERMKYTQININ